MITFLLPLNAVLISRLVLALSDGPPSRRQIVVMSVVQACLLACFRFELAALMLVAGLLLTTIGAGLIERRLPYPYLIRLILLLVQIVIIWIVVSAGGGLQLHAWTEAVLHNFSSTVQPTTALIHIAGFLVVTNEGTTLIRLLFQIFGLVPGQANFPVDRTEYGAGRLIGILERAILYLLVLLHQFGALGFIIAAKSFARFKELEDRQFAEYMLIGTLASSLVALVCGLLVAALV